MRRSVTLVFLALVGGCAITAPAPEVTGGPSLAASPTAPSRPASAGPSRLPATPAPTDLPPPTPDASVLDLEAVGCDGGTLLHWSSSSHPDFHHYVALRSPQFDIAPDWPPIAPAVDWGDTYATDRFVTSAVDASIIPSSTLWYYRVMAYDAAGEVLAASPVRSARMSPTDRLGAVRVEPTLEGRMRISWGRYGGPSACFTSYRVLVGTEGVASTLLGTVSDRDATELVTGALVAGSAVTLQVEAVRTTPLGSLVLGRTDPVTLTLPVP